VAGILSVALGSILLLCGAGSMPVKNLLPQGAMQGDLDAGGHSIVNAKNVVMNWQTIDATMVNTTGTDGNPAFALVPGNNYIIDQITNGSFELALPDPTTAANLPIRLRDANNSIGSSGGYIVTNDAGGSGAGLLWYGLGETDLSGSGLTQILVGGSQAYGDMIFSLGTDAVPQAIWVADNATSSGRFQCDSTSNLIVTGGSSVTMGNGPLRIVTDVQPMGGGGTLHIPAIASSGDSTFMVQGLFGGGHYPAGYIPISNGSGGLNWKTFTQLGDSIFNTMTFTGATYGSNALTITPQLYAGSFSGAGTGTTAFTVTIGQTMANTTYKVHVTPTVALATGAFYISAKTTTTFTVTYLTGLTGTVSFDWSVIP
jgi:hypothetical protein